jgi:hypothetical protein
MVEAIAIGVIVGFQEYRPERALAALRQMAAPVARVRMMACPVPVRGM